MKKVNTPEQTAHLFAHQEQIEAYTPTRNLYFYSDRIYSYGSHFCIARHAENKEGEKALFFTTRSYSNITAKHLHVVGYATRHLNKIHVPYPEKGMHSDNTKYWINEGEAIIKKLAKAKKPEIYLTQLERLKNEIEKYHTFEGLIIDPLLFSIINSNKEQANEYSAKKEQYLKEKQERELKEKQIKFKKDLKKFRSFENPTIYNRLDFDYLRVNEETQRIETSQRVEIPLQAAKVFYRALKNVSACAGNCGLKILNFELAEVTKTYIVVGCHKIEKKEINRIVKLLGW